jgi:mRNA interferase RelE/StbE
MGAYSIHFRKSVAKDLRSIPKKDLIRILSHIDALALDPRPPGSEKLSGLDRYRLRVGVYRILYEIEDAVLTVLVVKVAHRRDAYRS